MTAREVEIVITQADIDKSVGEVPVRRLRLVLWRQQEAFWQSFNRLTEAVRVAGEEQDDGRL